MFVYLTDWYSVMVVMMSSLVLGRIAIVVMLGELSRQHHWNAVLDTPDAPQFIGQRHYLPDLARHDQDLEAPFKVHMDVH
jgi:hypothetical protein